MHFPLVYSGSNSIGALQNMLIRCKEQLEWYLDLKAPPITCKLCEHTQCCSLCAWAYCAGRTCDTTGLYIKRDRDRRKKRVAQLRRWIVKIEKDITKQEINRG